MEGRRLFPAVRETASCLLRAFKLQIIIKTT